MDALPVRGLAVRSLDLPLPPDHMPPLRAGRPLKRWRYVGVYGPELMLCVGEARVGGMPQRWWAIALPDGTLLEHTGMRRGGVLLEPAVRHQRPGRVRVDAGSVSIDLTLDERPGIEVVSPHGRSYVWTRKQGGVPVQGEVRVGGRSWTIDGTAIVDDSAGYHARRTVWRWSAGVGLGVAGERVAWNLVDGIHDGAAASERTVWIDDVAHEAGPVVFAPDLSSVCDLSFSAWATRVDDTNRLVVRSRYRQPFGVFSGTLPGGGPELAAGFGVMEWHDALW